MYIKALDIKDDTALRIWNVELDQGGDRVKIVSDVAFSGVSHLYYLTEHLLMNNHARGIEAKGKAGAPKKKLEQAFERLCLKDELTSDQKNSQYAHQLFRRNRCNLHPEVGDLVSANH